MGEKHHDEHRGRRWGRIFGLLFLLFILAAFVGHWIWGKGAAGRVEKQVAAYKAAGEPIEPADFIVTGVADADNAVLDLRKAAAAIQGSSPNFKTFEEMEPADFALREKEIDLLRKVLAENAAVFGHIEKATTKSGVDWQLNFNASPVLMILLPDLNPQRQMARLLAADAVLAHHDGDDARALKRIDQILFLSRANGKQPFLVGHLVSIGIGALGTDRAASIGLDLRVGANEPKAATREQVGALIKQLLDDKADKQSQRMALLGERMSQLDAARQLLSGRMNLNQLAGARGGAGANVLAALAGYAFKPTFNSDALLMMRHTTALMNAAQAAPDWSTFQNTAPTFPTAVLNAKPWQHMLARILMPSLERAVLTDFRHMTDRRLTATSLAIRLYALDHGGRLPPTLSALVPKYLPSIPLDPLAAGGKPIGYIPDPPRPMLYSVGENGVDDGGSEQPYKTRRSGDPSRWERMDVILDLTRQPRPAPEVMDDGVGGLSTQPATTGPVDVDVQTNPAP